MNRGARLSSRDEDVAPVHRAELCTVGPWRARLSRAACLVFALALAAPALVSGALAQAEQAAPICPTGLSLRPAPPGCPPGVLQDLWGPIGWAVLAVVVGLGIAVVAWLRWVKAEIETFRRNPVLLPTRGRRPVIAGAEPDAPSAVPQPANALAASQSARPLARPAPIPAREAGLGVVGGASGAAAAPRPAAPAARRPETKILPLPITGSAVPSPAPSALGAPAPFEPEDATLQFVPGRLVMEGAVGAGRELRFVRQPGPATEVTIGRQEGEPGRHVRLSAPTVSRLHGRLRIESGRWSVTNLSRTNPLTVNGVELAELAAQMLVDGDRVGIGEVVLVYRER